MTELTRRTVIAGLGVLFAPAVTRAAQTSYVLDPDGSNVGFTFYLNGIAQEGTMPVTQAAVTIDPNDLTASTVDVSVSVARARTHFLFATNALKSEGVLDAANHPNVRFVSQSIRLGRSGRISSGARITGLVTVRGVTKPLTFDADLFRKSGSSAGDLRELSVRLTGSIKRSAFGATGYADLVDDQVDLNIKAALRRA